VGVSLTDHRHVVVSSRLASTRSRPAAGNGTIGVGIGITIQENTGISTPTPTPTPMAHAPHNENCCKASRLHKLLPHPLALALRQGGEVPSVVGLRAGSGGGAPAVGKRGSMCVCGCEGAWQGRPAPWRAFRSVRQAPEYPGWPDTQRFGHSVLECAWGRSLRPAG